MDGRIADQKAGFGASPWRLCVREHFNLIAARFQNLRLALLPIDAYRPEWFMGPLHMNPEEAVEANRILDVGTAMAIHFGTFSLAADGELEPTARLCEVLDLDQKPPSFWMLNHGEAAMCLRS